MHQLTEHYTIIFHSRNKYKWWVIERIRYNYTIQGWFVPPFSFSYHNSLEKKSDFGGVTISFSMPFLGLFSCRDQPLYGFRSSFCELYCKTTTEKYQPMVTGIRWAPYHQSVLRKNWREETIFWLGDCPSAAVLGCWPVCDNKEINEMLCKKQ